MNRIILIGNGFDLAHGLKTSYTQFINYIWQKIIREIKDSEPHKTFNNEEIRIEDLPGRWSIGYEYKNFIKDLEFQNGKITYNNKFLERITERRYLQNWVDIENEYYELLKESFKDKNCEYNINELNSDFEKIKEYLKEYLLHCKTEFDKKINDLKLINNVGYKIYSNFSLKDFSESLVNEKALELYNSIKKDQTELSNGNITMDDLNDEKRALLSLLRSNRQFSEIRELLISDRANNFINLQPEQLLFLNFNYTFTESLYTNYRKFDFFDFKNSVKVKSNHIHGTINNHDKNPIIFGFGDEIDKDYKLIEDLNDNDYLENIKSIKYLETENYKLLLEFINSEKYQIFTLGHSCGISDRTLLNTLFEHENCVSIKPFYHQKNENEDNYNDIVQNISRNFNNKATMRDKVVNKTYCSSLI